MVNSFTFIAPAVEIPNHQKITAVGIFLTKATAVRL